MSLKFTSLTGLSGFGGISKPDPAPIIIAEMLSSQGHISAVKPLFSMGVQHHTLVGNENAAIPRSSLLRTGLWDGSGSPTCVLGDYEFTDTGTPIWTDTLVGMGWDLPGSNDYSEIIGSNIVVHALKIQPPFTIEVIFIPDNVSAQRGIWCNDRNTGEYAGVNVTINSDALFRFDIGRANGGSSASSRRTFIGDTTLINGTLYHGIIACRSITDISMFLNGVKETTANSGSTPTLGFTTSFVAIGTAGDIAVNGDLDGRLIYTDFCDYAYDDDFIRQRFLDPYAPLRLKV